MRSLAWIVGLVLLAAAGTWFFGWPGAVIAGAAAGYLAPRRLRPVWLGIATTMLAWGVLLMYDAGAEGFAALADILTAVTGAALPLLLAGTLLLGGLLAAGGALLGAAARPPLSGSGS